MPTLETPETVQYTDVYRQCSCNNTQVQKYQKRISGPLLEAV
jgi:predicted ATPase with chaperone activity